MKKKNKTHIQYGICWHNPLDPKPDYYIDHAVPLPIGMENYLVKMYERFRKPFEFVLLWEPRDNKTYYSISVCHPRFDSFDINFGSKIAKGRLERLMGIGRFKKKNPYTTYHGKVLKELPGWVGIENLVLYNNEPKGIPEEKESRQ